MKRHWLLIVLLVFVNSFFWLIWKSEANVANEVARQWLRLLFPAMMLVISGILAVIYFAIRFVFKKFVKQS